MTKLVTSVQEIDALMSKGFVKPSLTGIHDYIITLTSVSGKKLEMIVSTVDSSVIQTKGKSDETGHKNINDWIDEWRRVWRKKGPHKTPMGTRTICVSKMREFFQMFPKYTKEHVFKARDKYFDHLDGNFTYLEKADNFISRQIATPGGETTVRRTLLGYCEEVVMDEQFGEEESDAFSIYEDV